MFDFPEDFYFDEDCLEHKYYEHKFRRKKRTANEIVIEKERKRKRK